jgi:hypothetical protein
VRFNNGAADSQSDAGSMSFGGKECIKDLVRLLRWKPTPVSLTQIRT